MIGGWFRLGCGWPGGVSGSCDRVCRALAEAESGRGWMERRGRGRGRRFLAWWWHGVKHCTLQLDTRRCLLSISLVPCHHPLPSVIMCAGNDNDTTRVSPDDDGDDDDDDDSSSSSGGSSESMLWCLCCEMRVCVFCVCGGGVCVVKNHPLAISNGLDLQPRALGICMAVCVWPLACCWNATVVGRGGRFMCVGEAWQLAAELGVSSAQRELFPVCCDLRGMPVPALLCVWTPTCTWVCSLFVCGLGQSRKEKVSYEKKKSANTARVPSGRG